MKEIAIEVKDVRIHYKLMKNFSIQRNLLKRNADKPEIFEAVRGVSFDVEKGEILGVIGKMEVENQHFSDLSRECLARMKEQLI